MKAYFRDVREFAKNFWLGVGLVAVNGVLLTCAVATFPIVLAVEIVLTVSEAWNK